jgi:hypothetical protein
MEIACYQRLVLSRPHATFSLCGILAVALQNRLRLGLRDCFVSLDRNRNRDGDGHWGADAHEYGPSSLTLQSVATYNAHPVCIPCPMKEPLNVIHIPAALETEAET